MSAQDKMAVDTPAKHAARIAKALGYSIQGLRAAYKEEAAIRLECWCLAVLLPCALLAPVSAGSRAVMVATLMLVPIVELINSSIEAVVDRIGSERHELSGRAKDMGSAAVLVASLSAALCWGVCLWPWAKSWF